MEERIRLLRTHLRPSPLGQELTPALQARKHVAIFICRLVQVAAAARAASGNPHGRYLHQIKSSKRVNAAGAPIVTTRPTATATIQPVISRRLAVAMSPDHASN